MLNKQSVDLLIFISKIAIFHNHGKLICFSMIAFISNIELISALKRDRQELICQRSYHKLQV